MDQEIKGLDKGKLRAYWKYNVRLTTFTMIVWFVVTYVAIFFSPQLNTIDILGFPLGYYLGAQGALIVFVWLIFNYARKMNKADVEYGVQEETD
jgi:putative solute:sodium symporter small subunit